MTPMQQDQQHQPKPPPSQAAAAAAAPAGNPRVQGALFLGIGLALEGVNGAFLVNDNTFYPKLLLIGAVLMPLGFWMLVTGIAYDKNNPVKPPTWWTAGAVALSLLGLGLGIFAMVLL